jgi:hypothetical protein
MQASTGGRATTTTSPTSRTGITGGGAGTGGMGGAGTHGWSEARCALSSSIFSAGVPGTATR